MDKETREAAAVVIGGFALFFAVFLAILLMVREGNGIWAVPLVALVFWREFVFAGMRMELDRLRNSRSS